MQHEKKYTEAEFKAAQEAAGTPSNTLKAYWHWVAIAAGLIGSSGILGHQVGKEGIVIQVEIVKPIQIDNKK
jgi:hypothetical protein